MRKLSKLNGYPDRVGAVVGLLALASAFAAPLASYAQYDPAAANGLATTAPNGSLLAATSVVPTSTNTPSEGTQGPGILTATTPGVLSPSSNSPTELPLPDSGGAQNASASRTLTSYDGKTTTATDIGTSRRFRYSFRLSLIGTYDDNIFLDQNNKQEDFFFIIQPGISLGVGDVINRQENFVRLDYSAGIFLFADHDENDSVQHLIRLDAQYRLRKLTLSGSQEVQILDGADLTGTNIGGGTTSAVNLDVSGRTRLNIYTTRLKANYILSDKTSFDLGGLYSVSDYNTLLDSTVASGDLFFNYALSGKITLGIGVSGGYVFAETPTPDQSFEQANVRMTYTATEKLSFTGTAGVEFRQSDGRGGTQATPVFDLSAIYQPFDSTSFALTASRRVLSSATLGGQDFQSSGVTLSVRQRFLQKIYASLSGGYENSHYVSILDGVNATRDDDYYFVQVGVDYSIREFLNFGVVYQHRENSSSAINSDFNDNQVSVRTTVSF